MGDDTNIIVFFSFFLFTITKFSFSSQQYENQTRLNCTKPYGEIALTKHSLTPQTLLTVKPIKCIKKPCAISDRYDAYRGNTYSGRKRNKKITRNSGYYLVKKKCTLFHNIYFKGDFNQSGGGGGPETPSILDGNVSINKVCF